MMSPKSKHAVFILIFLGFVTGEADGVETYTEWVLRWLLRQVFKLPYCGFSRDLLVCIDFDLKQICKYTIDGMICKDLPDNFRFGYGVCMYGFDNTTGICFSPEFITWLKDFLCEFKPLDIPYIHYLCSDSIDYEHAQTSSKMPWYPFYRVLKCNIEPCIIDYGLL